jgi:hypothetical protein
MNIRSSISGDLELIMSASEDGKIYVWQNVELEDSNDSPDAKAKDYSDEYENFFATASQDPSKTPSKWDRYSKSTKSACAIFAPMEIVSNANAKLHRWGVDTRSLKQIILVGTLDGRIKIFHSEAS